MSRPKQLRADLYAFTRGGDWCPGGTHNGTPCRLIRRLTDADALPADWGREALADRPIDAPRGWLVELPDGRRCPWPAVGSEVLDEEYDEWAAVRARDAFEAARLRAVECGRTGGAA